MLAQSCTAAVAAVPPVPDWRLPVSFDFESGTELGVVEILSKSECLKVMQVR